jgi:predicted polyphosphate/ATP-dependent NAD kinase
MSDTIRYLNEDGTMLTLYRAQRTVGGAGAGTALACEVYATSPEDAARIASEAVATPLPVQDVARPSPYRSTRVQFEVQTQVVAPFLAGEFTPVRRADDAADDGHVRLQRMGEQLAEEILRITGSIPR